METPSTPLPSRRSPDSAPTGGNHLRLVDPDFDAQLLAERDRLAAEYDRRPDLFRCLAELPMRSHEPVRDFAERRAAVTLGRQVADIVCWTGIAVLLVGIAAVVLP